MTEQFPNSFKIDGTTVTDKTDIANQFKLFFTNIGPKLASQISSNGKCHTDYLKNQTIHKFMFKPISEETTINIINRMHPKSSSGKDGISTILLKTIKHEICKPVTTILKQSLSTGIFPDKLKVAKIIPLFKKGDNTILYNYRPISILSAISKVFERVIFDQLHEYFHNRELCTMMTADFDLETSATGIASNVGTITQEVVMRLSTRYPRVYTADQSLSIISGLHGDIYSMHDMTPSTSSPVAGPTTAV